MKRKKRSYFVSVVDRVYKYLPFFLLLMAGANVYFVIRFVNREKRDFLVVRDRALANVSNTYAFVESSITNEICLVRAALSNEILRVRLSNDMRMRSVYNGFHTNSLQRESFEIKSSRVPERTPVPARFFRFAGRAYLDFGSSIYFSVGEDFGYGVIEAIYPTGVLCDGLLYPYQTVKREVVGNVVP